MPPGAGSDRRARRLGIAAAGILAAAIVVPALLAPRGWLPTTDWALLELRLRDVGSSFPLLGPPSAARFHHPGPLLYLVLAPLYRLAGADAHALVVGAALVNAATVAGIAWTAWRRGGLKLVLLTLVIVAWLLGSLPAGFTGDPWNPWLAVLPCFWFVLLTWSVLEDDIVLLPAAVFVGSFLVQSHIGYLFLVGAGFLASAVAVARSFGRGIRGGAEGRPDRRRLAGWVAVAAAVLVVLWAPPFVQQVTGPDGNLSAGRAAFSSSAQGERVTADETLGVLAAEAGGIAPWWTGHESIDTIANQVIPGNPVNLLVPVGLLAVGLVAGWRERSARRLVLVVAGAALVGSLSVWRLEADRVLPYVVRFLWPLAALTVLSAAWAVLVRLGFAGGAGPVSGDGGAMSSAADTAPDADDRVSAGASRRTVAGWAVVGLVVLVSFGRFAARPPTDPPVFQTMRHGEEAACVESLLPAIRADAGSSPIHLAADEGDWPILTAPVANELDRAGRTVTIDPALSFFVDRPGRAADAGEAAYVVVTDARLAAWAGRADAHLVASCDRLTPGERAELDAAQAPGGGGVAPLRVLDLSLRDLRAQVFRVDRSV